jgi:hypothetical protein
MKRARKDLSIYSSTAVAVHWITGSNCGTRHLVPRDLDEKDVHLLMGLCFLHLPLSAKNIRRALRLQEKGYILILGSVVGLQPVAAKLVERLKKSGWYYWAGGDCSYVIPELTGRVEAYQQHVR